MLSQGPAGGVVSSWSEQRDSGDVYRGTVATGNGGVPADVLDCERRQEYLPVPTDPFAPRRGLRPQPHRRPAGSRRSSRSERSGRLLARGVPAWPAVLAAHRPALRARRAGHGLPACPAAPRERRASAARDCAVHIRPVRRSRRRVRNTTARSLRWSNRGRRVVAEAGVRVAPENRSTVRGALAAPSRSRAGVQRDLLNGAAYVEVKRRVRRRPRSVLHSAARSRRSTLSSDR